MWQEMLLVVLSMKMIIKAAPNDFDSKQLYLSTYLEHRGQYYCK